MPVERPFGTWPSPLSAEAVAAGAIQLEAVAVEDGHLYWIERRPSEQGRQVVVRQSADGTRIDLTPSSANVRSRVHEYGGGACCVDAGTVYYVNFDDQRMYRVTPGGIPVALTPPGAWRYADPIVDRRRNRIICVGEDHSRVGAGATEAREPVNVLVGIALDRGEHDVEILASGYDFYSTPRLDPRGDRLAWVCWRHPQMPWDGTELHVAAVGADGRLVSAGCVAGGEADAIVQPGWSSDGALHFLSDRSGWWNHYRLRDGRIEALYPMQADFARPPWELGQSVWAWAGPSRLVVTYARDGVWRIGVLDLPTGALRTLEDAPEPGSVILATESHACYVGRMPTAPDALVRVDLATGQATAICAELPPVLDRRLISEPAAMTFPTGDGETARLFYYAPANPESVPPPGEVPPLIVISHGGPTSAATTRLNLTIQFWTTRGFAVADVDYRGSSGYGRAFRERLKGHWGEFDVADCVAAAQYLAARGLADGERLMIRGGSAGGFTTLAALTFRAGVFKAGACYYGIGDLEALARDTHKFEARYTDRLIAPYPERADLYRERSPIHAVDRLACPVIFFHGRDDRAVPVNQAETMAAAIRAKGLRADLLIFEGEQHGFRQRATIAACLEAELAFYGDVFGFAPA